MPMKTRIVAVIKRADSPLKRIGLILLLMSLFYWISMAAYWNIYKHGFIYSYWETWTENAPKPLDDEISIWTQGHEILDDFVPSNGLMLDERIRRDGWVSYSKLCLKRHNRPMTISDRFPLQCRDKFIPDELKSKLIHRQSFGDFIENLFSSYSGGHLKLSIFFVILTGLGLLMLFGSVERCFQWVKTGEIKDK
jgi:hypothetical protein